MILKKPTLKKFAKKTEHPMSIKATVPVTRCSITPKNLLFCLKKSKI